MGLSTVKKLDSLEVIVLAAGKGTRMKSPLPKVIQPICGHPIVELVLTTVEEALRQATSHSGFQFTQTYFNVVVGHGRELVQKFVNDAVSAGTLSTAVRFTVQQQQLGTGHAVLQALSNSKTTDAKSGRHLVMVVSGDLPLLTADALASFLEEHVDSKSFASLLSARLPDAGAYGRVVRKGRAFNGVVEAKDASKAQLKIREFNGGVYIFDRGFLSEAIRGLDTKNASKEFYLPDVFKVGIKKKKRVLAHCLQDATILGGVNTMQDLAQAERELYRRTNDRWMSEGVRMSLPETIRISPFVQLSSNTSIDAFSGLSGRTIIGENSRIGSFCELRDTEVGKGTEIRNSVVAQNARIGDGSVVGPMAHLRPGTKIANKAKVGNFVEIKESKIGDGTSVAHLSYVGDAEVGSNTNIGCGFVTCNYDGNKKHRTVIGNRVFVGSDCQVVAPIELADGSFVASGTTVTESVKEQDSLVIARERQVTKPGYAKKYSRK